MNVIRMVLYVAGVIAGVLFAGAGVVYTLLLFMQ